MDTILFPIFERPKIARLGATLSYVCGQKDHSDTVCLEIK